MGNKTNLITIPARIHLAGTYNLNGETIIVENATLAIFIWDCSTWSATLVPISGVAIVDQMNTAIASALASYYTKSELDEALGGKQNTIDDLANIRSGAQAGSTAVQPSTLNSVVKNTVAESGVYDVSANNDNTKFESLSALLSSANLDAIEAYETTAINNTSKTGPTLTEKITAVENFNVSEVMYVENTIIKVIPATSKYLIITNAIDIVPADDVIVELV